MAKTATSDKDNPLSHDEPSRLVKNQKRMEEVVGAWWNEWYSQVFSSLVPYNKWKKEKTNLEVGDVCLVKYDHKVGKADYRICRVEEVEKDAKGLVRTVTVGMRPRDSREKTLPYKSKKLKSLRLAIQRLILICSAHEVNELLEGNENESVGHAINALTTAKPDWNEPDDRVEYLEDEDTEEITDPDVTRPAVPEAQQLQVLPHYALLAHLESAPGTSYESNHGITIIDPVLNHKNIQDCVTRDCLVDEVIAKDLAPSAHKNLEMCARDAVPKDSMNGQVEATTGTKAKVNAIVGGQAEAQDFEKYKVPELDTLDVFNTVNESIGALDTNEETTDCDSEKELQIRLHALRS